MNKSDGGKQRKQRDTVIPQSNPLWEHRGKPQKMTLPDGHPKGLQRVLEEHGFNVSRLCVHAKCSPVCLIESTGCFMARLLSQQEDFKHQVSMLETFIHKAGHECIFLPKFPNWNGESQLLVNLIQLSLGLSVLGLVQVPLLRNY
jgi:hypothetical protein